MQRGQLMITHNPNGIDLREMPARFEAAFNDIIEIRQTLWFLCSRMEIPLCHPDGTDLTREERQELEVSLQGPGALRDLVDQACLPVRDFVRALKHAMQHEVHPRTTGTADRRSPSQEG